MYIHAIDHPWNVLTSKKPRNKRQGCLLTASAQLLLVAVAMGVVVPLDMLGHYDDTAGSQSCGSCACAAREGVSRAYGAWSEDGGAGVVTGERLQVRALPVHASRWYR